MSRAVPFRRQPSREVYGRIAEAQQSRFLVVAEPGPTKFVIKAAPPQRADGAPLQGGQRVRLSQPVELEGCTLPTGTPGVVHVPGNELVEVEFAEFYADVPVSSLEPRGSEKKHTVQIGSSQRCSCMSSGDDLCVHVLFVMLRVYGVAANDEMVWQRGLTDAEVSKLLLMKASRRRARAIPSAPAAVTREVARREVDDDCAICYDAMDPHTPAGKPGCLVWCRRGCGNSVHYSCMRAWAQHHSDHVTCPNCRADWCMPLRPATPVGGGPRETDGVLGDAVTSLLRSRRPSLNGRRRSSGSCPQPAAHDVGCKNCGAASILGSRYNCCSCASYDLCAECFRDPLVHGQHAFLCIPRPGAAAVPCDRQSLAAAVLGTGLSVTGGRAESPGRAGYFGPPDEGGIGVPVAYSLSGTRMLSQQPRRGPAPRAPRAGPPADQVQLGGTAMLVPGVGVPVRAPTRAQQGGRLRRGRPAPPVAAF
eukprot:TRINITY_DN6244_c0_g1_i1.p2 TRINITY_DN6244_c0_g1~~TRINITY_DN6244_c0_g1_i1.p2  ORF type:complete len:477 (+),score=122.23 TRINITY_DN6244_c0_g1_i1:54-1484(+)